MAALFNTDQKGSPASIFLALQESCESKNVRHAGTTATIASACKFHSQQTLLPVYEVDGM